MTQQNSSEEIDLGYLFTKLNSFTKNLIRAFFRIIAFFVRFWIVVVILILLGVGYGYYADSKAERIFVSEGIVIPNFESVDYLYENIEHLNDKINQGDTLFLQNISSVYRDIRRIEIEPIPDIYNMMTKSREQIDVFRILFQNQDLEKFVSDITTSKYFKYHKITFTTTGKEHSQQVITDIFKFWDSNAHFAAYKETYRQNAELQIVEHKKMIAQVDSIIGAFTQNHLTSNSGVVISENPNLHQLLERKRGLLDELLEIELKQHDYDAVVKMANMDFNVERGSFLSNKVKHPIFLVLIFSGFFFVLYVFKSLQRYANSN